ncbi:Laminin subunit beta-1 [Eumeta japonica]|uniref:Laminin subunit beta-2 n=1 Tax=Eumeta variegata TaxID=151549 RepID=A0A4C1VYN3_EUMVA|nr:Laminin subunit beta-1 [Eumeta japonica]
MVVGTRFGETARAALAESGRRLVTGTYLVVELWSTARRAGRGEVDGARVCGRQAARQLRRCGYGSRPLSAMPRRTLFIFAIFVTIVNAVYNRERDRLRADPRLLDRACELSSCYPATGNLLIGRESRLWASSTCGLSKPERYCIVSHLEERKKCFWCESTNYTINNPHLNHRIQNIIYKYHPGTRNKSWWQSENGKENVTIQLDMEAEFHLTHLIIEFKTFRPAAMLVERSFDFGKTWRVYRYFAHNCNEAFPGISTQTQRSLTEVVCESRYSAVAPSTEGEVIFRVLPPNINVLNPYSEEVQNLLRMTNLRINFTKLHTLGDDLLDNRAEIQEKYYYAIYEMTVRGSCSCYGHASRCLPMPGVESKNNMVHGRCECTHNTRGLNCEYCEDFFNDLPWQPAVGKTSNACKRCVCNNHATSCHFDYAVYNITGKVSGGVCDDCQHNTMGRNCEQCKPFYYQDPSLDIQSPDICKPCDCDPSGSLDDGICDPYTDIATDLQAGHCHCKRNVGGKRCDACKDGFWNFDPNNLDGCTACTCDPLGTINDRGCDPTTGECICKRYVTGRNCNQCLPQFYGLSDSDDGCSPCDCDIGGSLDNNCDVITGQCKCRPNLIGRRCDQPDQKYFTGALDFMTYEAELSLCDPQIDDNAIQSQMCQIVIREPFRDGPKETWTGPGLMKVPEGSTLVFVIDDIKTSMNYNILIRYEPQSSVNWEEATIFIKRLEDIGYDSPCANIHPEDDTIYTSLPAHQRSILIKSPICFEKEKKYEIRIFLGRQDRRIANPRATVLIDSIVLLPSLDNLPIFGNDSSQYLRREEFERYNCGDSYYYDLHRANVPEVCRKFHASIGFYVLDGGITCHCDMTGSKSHQCENYGGQCPCKPNVVGRRCDRCAPGTFGISFDGCKACDCNNIGALDNICDATSGQCKCRTDTYDLQCDKCQPGYYNFPNCVQCDCNGHADTCEDKTGACINCRDYTEGQRCERCVKGYYGDPRLGIDISCRPCPCPRISVYGNESFAESCDLDTETKDVICECAQGYAGSRCDVCDDNYFGHPELANGSCKPCDCNDNIDLTKPGNCDSHTGKCLQCLHDTAGDHCEVCKEGYYRNSTTNQCLKCECNELGTNLTKGNCDGMTGRCPCYDNVIGDKCDSCAENHWRIALGKGCDPCECDEVGSISPQCNPYIGKCTCKKGFGGRQCNQCQENFWGNPKIECYPCQCDLYGSVSQQCLQQNGSCVCRPGMGGVKCDMCARGYLGHAPECYTCGECFDNWDYIIDDLKGQTQASIKNSSQIRLVGATGAYTRDFEEMTKRITEINNLLHSASVGETTVNQLFSNVSSLQDKLNIAEQKVKDSNKNLSDITSKIDIGTVALDGLRNNIENLQKKTLDLSNNATTLQEANLEGALNLTREAKQRANVAANDAENVQTLIAETDRQLKNTDKLIEMQYSTFNNTQNENEKKLTDLQEQLTQLENEIPKLNEYLCGLNSDTCDLCGGAGCGKCGGISCEQGAMTKVEKALDFANKTEIKIKEHELTAEDLFRSISQAKQDTIAAREKAKKTLNNANEFKISTERAINDTLNLTAQIKEFLSNTTTTPAEIRTLADEILKLSISSEPEEITELSKRINTTVSQLTNIENIINETKPALDKAKSLNSNATAAFQAANMTLQMANTVLQALDDAQAAQDAADNAITKASDDIEAAKNDLDPIALETQDAQMKANTTKEEVENLRLRLGNLQKNILNIESDAQKIKEESSDVVIRAENAEQQARTLRQSFKTTNMSLADRANKTLNSRERAQVLLNRATKLASDTQEQLRILQTMEELYNSHNIQRAALEKEIDELNNQMEYYFKEITAKSNYYRSCTT